MKAKIYLLLFLLLILIFVADDSYAISNGQIMPGILSIRYNVNLLDEIRAISLEGEYGMSSTLTAEGRYIYASPKTYLDLFLKFKLYESSDLNIAGRLGLMSDFSSYTPVYKTIGFAFSKYHNSFIRLNGGCDYSMTTGDIGYYVGIDYRLTSRAYLQAGWQKFIGQSDTDGFVIGLRTDL